MAFPIVGRKAVLKKGLVAVAGVKSKTVSINNEAIDITSDDDAGFRTLLADPGTQTLDMSVEGIAKDTTLLSAAIAGTALLSAYSLVIEGVGTIAGDFHLSSVELGATYNEAVTFTATLTSSGAFTFTAAP